MASVCLHDKGKQEILTEAFLDKRHTIDIPEGMASDQHNINIIEMPKDVAPHPEETCWIHRVPEKLRNIHKEAYTPQLVSIGPLHYGNPKLKAMELHKIKYEQEFWNRNFCKHILKEERMKFMGEKEEERMKFMEDIQSQYAVTFESGDRSKLESMILRDACFIFELFLRNYQIQLYNKKMKEETPTELSEEIIEHSEDPTELSEENIKQCYILRIPWLAEAVRQDLILLENQLPYFVLTRLFDFIFDHTSVNVPTYLPKLNEKCVRDDFIFKIAAEFFFKYYKFGKPSASGAAAKEKINCDDFKEIPIKHFTDLVRNFMLPVDWKKKINSFDDSDVRCLYSATQLDRAGVKFERRGPGDKEEEEEGPGDKEEEEERPLLADVKSKRPRLTDIEKKDGLCWRNGCCCYWINGCWSDLQVPELSVKDETECIMRNVMALEQFVYPDNPFICNYVFLLDQLINTEEDVQFLVDQKIVSNWLGSNNAVVDLVNRLCDQIVVSKFYYNELCKELNTHHDNPLNVFRATLNKVYFKDLFTISSTVVAAVFLIFSIFSIISTIKDLFSF